MADEKQMHIVLPFFVDMQTDREKQTASVPATSRWNVFGKIHNSWAQPASVTSPHIFSASKKVTVFVSDDSRELPIVKPLIGTWPGLQHTYSVISQAPPVTTPHELEAESEEAVQKAFEEIAASSSRILKSIERINSLAEETHGELNATRAALSLKE